MATLAHEGVTIESWFAVTLDGKHYLLANMRAVGMAAAHEAVKSSASRVDAYHRAFKAAAWGQRIKAELLVDLSRIDAEERFA